jgi:hypothetical protein
MVVWTLTLQLSVGRDQRPKQQGDLAMSEFDERLRRASQKFTQRTDLDQKAMSSREQTRTDFLVNFSLMAHRLIEPVLKQAKEHIQPPLEHGNDAHDDSAKKKAHSISSGVHWSDSEDRVTLGVSHGRARSAIVFVADPAAVHVRVIFGSYTPSGKTDYRGRLDVDRGEGDNTAVVAELPLHQIDKARIEGWVADFIEGILK